jgi:hypothetical protein
VSLPFEFDVEDESDAVDEWNEGLELFDFLRSLVSCQRVWWNEQYFDEVWVDLGLELKINSDFELTPEFDGP